MLPREFTENSEKSLLCRYATFSADTKGREIPHDKCDLRTEFQRDRDKIIHCNSFRRLKHKTQVFLSPMGDHYRTRLTHTLEVSQIARTIARALRLNEDLTEAIALGHDLGHTPFGHAGERVLNELAPHGFKHYEQSLRVVKYIENEGKGLNLTYEVQDGIVNHVNLNASTREGQIVRYADVIAYINHDIDDSIRGGIISEKDIPNEITDVLGHSKSERITTLVTDLVNNGAEDLHMTDEVKKAFDSIHEFMFDNVYRNPRCKSEESKTYGLLENLYKYYCSNVEKMPKQFQLLADRFDKETAVCDYIAGMTDCFAVELFSDLFIPASWNKL
ncbi:MAG: deoxyguanosinetriphosphate triphosphohydrolase [Oscillospiraceae bacterium]